MAFKSLCCQFACEFFAVSSGTYVFHVPHHFDNRDCLAVVVHSNKVLQDPLPLQFFVWFGSLGGGRVGCFFFLTSNSLSHLDFIQKARWVKEVCIRPPQKVSATEVFTENFSKLLWKTVCHDEIYLRRKTFC